MPKHRTANPPTSHRVHCVLRASGVAMSVGILMLAGACSSPLQNKADRDLRRSIRESSERELVEAEAMPEVQRLTRESRVEALGIKPEDMEELRTMAGPASYAGANLPLGDNLFGQRQKVVRVTLERAISSTVRNNLNVEFARLAPAIDQQQLIAAEAAFDWVFFAAPQFSNTDEPRTSTFGSNVFTNNTTTWEATVGVRKPLIAGGQLAMQTEIQYLENNTRGINQVPDPARTANFVIQLDQPLLRGFGTDTVLAQVRLARNAELDSIQQLKGTLLTSVNDAEAAYWALVRAASDVLVLQRLLERGEDVLDALKKRQKFTKPSAISNAAAAVESRRANVIRAQRTLRDASDRLKTIMNDPDLTVGSEIMVLPQDRPVDQSIDFSLVDSINTAIANRPEVQRAVLSLDNTSIRQVVADNGRLPRLDLRALTRFNGQNDAGEGFSDTYGDIAEAQFVDYQIGLNFEQAIGNRAAEATFRQRRLERMQATIAYRNTLQGVVAEVKSALRDISTNYVLIEQTKATRIAAAEDLRTLLVDERTIQAITPEFLNLKLQRQEALAGAEQQEVATLADYNTSMARLYTATGTSLERNKIQFRVPPVKQAPQTTNLFPDFPLEPRHPSLEQIEQR